MKKYLYLLLLSSLCLLSYSQSFAPLYSTADNYNAWGIAFNPDGSLLALAMVDDTIRILDADSGRQVASLVGHTYDVTSVAFSPDGSFLASGSDDNTVKIWRTADFSLVASLEEHTGTVFSVAFSPAGDFLASGSTDRTVKIWRTADFSLVASLEQHTDWVRSVAFSPAGDFLASGSRDKTVKIWRTADFSLVDSLEENTETVTSVAFSPAGDFLASGSSDKTVKIWRTDDFSLVASLEEHTDIVISVAFSPAGDFLASGSYDNTVKIWHANDSYSLHKTIAGVNTAHYYFPSLAFHPRANILATANGLYGSSTTGRISFWAMPAAVPPCALGGCLAQRKALVIGNTVYQQELASLANPANDADAVAAALRSLGFTVQLHHDLDFRAMSRALSSFRDSLEEGDVALFFYAGHGSEVHGENYLIPTDIDFARDAIEHVSLSLNDVLRSFDAGGAKLSIVIVDACRNNAGRGGKGFTGVSLDTLNSYNRNFDVEPTNDVQGVFIAFSTSPGALASDGPGRQHSPYATQLLQHLATPNMPIEQVFKDIREGVFRDTNRKQRPWDNSNLIGDFYFNQP